MAHFWIVRSEEFDEWLDDQQPGIQSRVIARLDLLSMGHFGDHRRFDGLLELRWKNGTRVYLFLRGATIVILYGGGKNAQERDIEKAKKIRKRFLAGS